MKKVLSLVALGLALANGVTYAQTLMQAVEATRVKVAEAQANVTKANDIYKKMTADATAAKAAYGKAAAEAANALSETQKTEAVLIAAKKGRRPPLS